MTWSSSGADAGSAANGSGVLVGVGVGVGAEVATDGDTGGDEVGEDGGADVTGGLATVPRSRQRDDDAGPDAQQHRGQHHREDADPARRPGTVTRSVPWRNAADDGSGWGFDGRWRRATASGLRGRGARGLRQGCGGCVAGVGSGGRGEVGRRRYRGGGGGGAGHGGRLGRDRMCGRLGGWCRLVGDGGQGAGLVPADADGSEGDVVFGVGVQGGGHGELAVQHLADQGDPGAAADQQDAAQRGRLRPGPLRAPGSSRRWSR